MSCSASRPGRPSTTRSGSSSAPTSSISSRPRRWQEYFRPHARGPRQHRRHRRALQSGIRFQNLPFPAIRHRQRIDPRRRALRADGPRGIQSVSWRASSAKTPKRIEAVYRARLDYEIGVIREMGFPSYFLIVSGLHPPRQGKAASRWGPAAARRPGASWPTAWGSPTSIPSPTASSSSGSSIPARKSMPDIDVDFCIDGREEVYQYVVGQVRRRRLRRADHHFRKAQDPGGASGTWGARWKFRCRRWTPSPRWCRTCSTSRCEEALDRGAAAQGDGRAQAGVGELIRICRVLEGLPRHASTHAAGVVISDRPLVEYLPLFRARRAKWSPSST